MTAEILPRTVAMRDGRHLAADVYLPTIGRPCPALVLRTPYGRRGDLDAIVELAAAAAGRGLALVTQDVRGKFDSATGGRPRPFVQEFHDGHDTVAWLAEQSFCDGRVIPIGESYCGFTALAAAASRHAAVKAVLAGMSTSRVATQWLHRQGVFRLQQNAEWALFAWGGPTLPEPLPYVVSGWHDVPLDQLRWGDGDWATLRRFRDASALDDATFAAGRRIPLAEAVDVPVMCWTGWWDVFARGVVDEYRAAVRARPHQPHHLDIAATDHLSWTGGGPSAGRSGHMAALWGRQLDLLVDRVLVAREDDVDAQVHATTTGGERVRTPTWPPDTGRVEWHLADTPHRFAASRDSLPDSAERLVWAPLLDPPDELATAARPDVAAAVMVAPTPALLAGDMELEITVAGRAPAQLAVTLAARIPGGPLRRLADGAVRWPVGQTAAVVDLGPIGHDVVRGEEIVVLVARDSFPRYLPDQAYEFGRLIGPTDSNASPRPDGVRTTNPASGARDGVAAACVSTQVHDIVIDSMTLRLTGMAVPEQFARLHLSPRQHRSEGDRSP